MIFLQDDHLKMHAARDHDVQLCHIKMLDYEENDPFVRVLKSMTRIILKTERGSIQLTGST